MHLARAIIARTLFLGALTCQTAVFLYAQVVPAAVGPGAYIGIGGGVSAFQSVYGQREIAGALLYADVHPHWRVGFEGELRFLRWRTSENVTMTDYLGGPHIMLFEHHHIDLYAKFLAGVGRMTFPFNYAHGAFLVLAPGAGVDIPLNHVVTLRVIDFEYQYWPQFTFGAITPYGLSTGVRFRVTPTAWIPRSVRKRRVRISRAERRSANATAAF